MEKTTNLFTVVDPYSNADVVRYMLPLFKDEIETIEDELQRREEVDKIIRFESLEVKQILKVDYANRKIIRYKRYVSPSGEIVKRSKDVFNISTIGMLDSRDRERSLLMCSGGFSFVYFKKSNGFAPGILSNNGELIDLPKDFLKKFNVKPKPQRITISHGGNRLSMRKPMGKICWRKSEG